MTPGPVEEVGKVATGFIDSMKSQPLALAMIALNAAFLIFFWFIFSRAAEHGHEREQALFAAQKELRDGLVECAQKARSQ